MKPEPQPPKSDAAGSGRWLLRIFKLLVAGLVLWWSGGTLIGGLRQLSTDPPAINFGVAAAAGVVYLIGFSAMAWFWRVTLRALGQPCDWIDVGPAYFLGHLGKYVPGKVMVVLLRTGALRRAGGSAGPIAASVFIDTLTLMTVGAVLACVLLACGLIEGVSRGPLVAASLVLAPAACLPTAPPVLRWLMRRLAGADSQLTTSISWRLVGAGWLAACVTWAGLTLSIWLVLRSLDPALPFSAGVLLRCLLTATLPMVAGFLVFVVPGGLGVRDELVSRLLVETGLLTAGGAAAAAILVRLVWIASEASACGMLVIARRLLLKKADGRRVPPA